MNSAGGVVVWILIVALLGCPGSPPESERTDDRTIFYGDLHVHSTNSVDVFALKLPLFGHDGRVSPMDHCHYARFCSQLDFWAITDHQEGAPPSAWDESVEAVLSCNALYGGNEADPGLVSFAGFEWQQSHQTPESDWGHKNVIFPGNTADELPARAVASADQVTSIDENIINAAIQVASAMDPDNIGIYDEVGDYARAGATAPKCAEGVHTRDLPTDCVESASEPVDLYSKLDEWGFPALVIPHGTTWGAHHPPLMSWEHQLDREQHHAGYQTLVEIYSGHGSIEAYRSWRGAEDVGDGTLRCVEPTPDFEPCCYRAGEIARNDSAECASDPAGAPCLQEVLDAQQAYLDAGRDGLGTQPQAVPEDWLDCDQCRDCFQPAEGHRPLGSAQAALAMSHFAAGEVDARYHFGFLGSTDTHAVGPGAGYKEGKYMSDIMGSAKLEWEPVVNLMVAEIFPNWVRQNSFFHSGGLVAVHADGSDREAIWAALEDRTVYATTGERIELWFDLVSGDGATMGAAATISVVPVFAVKATGSFVQEPGCPDWVPEFYAEGSCHGECYNPTTSRHGMDRIEVVRIRPQIAPDEDLSDLIDDPFVVLDCEGESTCEVTFSDPDFLSGGRDALYYVRAIQVPSGQLNHEDLRCEDGPEGECLSVDICQGGARGEADDCIQEGGERAWASPIYLSPG
jgi:hypothetical protein